MSLRDLVAGAARTSAGVWQEVAEAIEPSDERRQQPDQLDLTDDRPSPGGPTPAGDAMLVPIDSWTRIVDQLANLHEAGQQLAEARERAARAETEASFLRRQLAEAREQTSSRARPVPEGSGGALAPGPASDAVAARPGSRAWDAAMRTQRRARSWVRR